MFYVKNFCAGLFEGLDEGVELISTFSVILLARLTESSPKRFDLVNDWDGFRLSWDSELWFPLAQGKVYVHQVLGENGSLDEV